MITWGTLLPFIVDVVVFFSIYLIFTTVLNMQQGYTGIANLGLFFWAAAGAYVFALLPTNLALWIFDIKLNFIKNNAMATSMINAELQANPLISISLLLLTVVVVMVIGAVLGYIVSRSTLRLSSVYLSVFLLCIAEGMRVIGMQYGPIAGGRFGIIIPNFFGWLGDYSWIGLSVTIVIIAVIIFFVIQRVCNSPFGRLLKGVRENELAVQCMGKNTNEIKIKVFVFTSAFLALAGVLISLNTGTVIAETYNRVDYAFWPWLMALVGGFGNHKGVLLGTFLCVIARRVVLISKFFFDFLPFDVMWLEPILLGIVLILFISFRPRGIFPEKPAQI